MKRTHIIFATTAIMLVSVAFPAYAGVWGSIRGWVSGQALAWIITGILAIGGIGASVMFTKIVRTLKELGEFLTKFAEVLADKKTTREELSDLVKEGKDVLDVWKNTPEQYKVN